MEEFHVKGTRDPAPAKIASSGKCTAPALRKISNRGTKTPAAWQEQSAKLAAGEISKEDYDRRRCYYPKYDTTQIWEKVPSQGLSDAMVEVFKDKLKDM